MAKLRCRLEINLTRVKPGLFILSRQIFCMVYVTMEKKPAVILPFSLNKGKECLVYLTYLYKILQLGQGTCRATHQNIFSTNKLMTSTRIRMITIVSRTTVFLYCSMSLNNSRFS